MNLFKGSSIQPLSSAYLIILFSLFHLWRTCHKVFLPYHWGHLCEGSPMGTGAGHLHLSSGTQWVTGRCQWYHAPYNCFSKKQKESTSSFSVCPCYGWLRPLRVTAALELMPGLTGVLQLEKQKGFGALHNFHTGLFQYLSFIANLFE